MFFNNNINRSDLDVFKLNKIRYDLIQRIVSKQRYSYRQAIASVKDLSNVSGSTRKIYKQKGTGRARHGSPRRAQFRGGSVIFGPTNKKNFGLSYSTYITRLALLHCISYKSFINQIIVYDKLLIQTLRSSNFLKIYNQITTQKTLFVDISFCRNFVLSHRNISTVRSILVHNISVLDIVSSNILIVSRKAINYLIGRLI